MAADQDVTCPAFTGAAAEMRTGDSEPAAQHVEQRLIRIDINGDCSSVKRELNIGHDRHGSGLLELLDDLGPFRDVASQELLEFLWCHRHGDGPLLGPELDDVWSLHQRVHG